MHLWLAFFRGLFGLFPPRQPGEAREDGDEHAVEERLRCDRVLGRQERTR